MRRILVSILFALALLAASITGWPGSWILPASAAAPLEAPSSSASLADLEDAFARTVDQLQPAVVSVITRSSKRRFRRGIGSGIIIDSAGHILTNNHVVAEGDRYTVNLNDGQRVPATLVGTDPQSDLAVLQIKTRGLVVARLGDSDRVRVGQWVLAMGTPQNLPRTVTAGIISAKGRSGLELAQYEDFLQTDAAINQGSSGGPLVNLRGEVVGIATAILSPRTGSQGISFAIPINMAKQVLQQLIKNGRVTRGYLGVVLEDLTQRWAERLNYDDLHGVVVTEVVENSPAQRAGLKAQDVVVQIDGHALAGRQRLMWAIAQHAPGDRALVQVWRKGEKIDLKVLLGNLDSVQQR